MTVDRHGNTRAVPLGQKWPAALVALKRDFDPGMLVSRQGGESEIERAVDRFYEGPLNEQIRIEECLKIISFELQIGEPDPRWPDYAALAAHGQQSIDGIIRDARKSAAQQNAKDQK